MLKGFRKFLMHGDVVVVATGLVVALAFSNLVEAFTTNVITPLVNRAQGAHPIALGIQVGSTGSRSTFLNFGALISAFIYFFVFMGVVYVAVVVPYRTIQARRGRTVFGEPPLTKTCPFCLADDLAPAAVRCRHCTSELPAVPAASTGSEP